MQNDALGIPVVAGIDNTCSFDYHNVESDGRFRVRIVAIPPVYNLSLE